MSILKVFTKRETPSKPDSRWQSMAVPFDPKLVTDTVEDDLRANIEKLADIRAADRDALYEVAHRSISRGGDLAILASHLRDGKGLSAQRASLIALSLNKKATAIITMERQLANGITRARWLASGAPCGYDTPYADAHAKASGKAYRVEQGMFINGAWTYPGREDECGCVSQPIIPGLSD